MSGGLHCKEKPVDVIVDVIAVELSGGPEGAVTEKEKEICYRHKESTLCELERVLHISTLNTHHLLVCTVQTDLHMDLFPHLFGQQ